MERVRVRRKIQKKYQNLPYWAHTGCFKPKKRENGQIRHFLALLALFSPKTPFYPHITRGGGYMDITRGGAPFFLRSMAPTLQLFHFFSNPHITTPLAIWILPPPLSIWILLGGGVTWILQGGGGIMGVDTMHIGAAALGPGIAASAGGPAAYSHSAGQHGPLLKMVLELFVLLQY